MHAIFASGGGWATQIKIWRRWLGDCLGNTTTARGRQMQVFVWAPIMVKASQLDIILSFQW